MRQECRERFPRHLLQRKTLVSDPSMHHGTCVTHVPWCMSGSLTRGDGENFPGIPGACATRHFTYLTRCLSCLTSLHQGDTVVLFIITTMYQIIPTPTHIYFFTYPQNSQLNKNNISKYIWSLNILNMFLKWPVGSDKISQYFDCYIS